MLKEGQMHIDRPSKSINVTKNHNAMPPNITTTASNPAPLTPPPNILPNPTLHPPKRSPLPPPLFIDSPNPFHHLISITLVHELVNKHYRTFNTR